MNSIKFNKTIMLVYLWNKTNKKGIILVLDSTLFCEQQNLGQENDRKQSILLFHQAVNLVFKLPNYTFVFRVYVINLCLKLTKRNYEGKAKSHIAVHTLRFTLVIKGKVYRGRRPKQRRYQSEASKSVRPDLWGPPSGSGLGLVGSSGSWGIHRYIHCKRLANLNRVSFIRHSKTVTS